MTAAPRAGSFTSKPGGTAKCTTSCDLIMGCLARSSVSYENEAAPEKAVAKVKIGDKTIEGFEGSGLPAAELTAKTAALNKQLGDEIKAHGYPSAANRDQMNIPMLVLTLAFLGVLVTMLYGTIARMSGAWPS